MDEMMNQTTEQEPETTDFFMEGWDGTDEAEADQPLAETEPTEEGGEPSAEGEGESAETPEQPPETPPAEGDTFAQTTQSQQQTADARPQTWELRHLGEVKQANEAEMVALAQKGMDYDRLRSQYDEFKPVMDILSTFANKQGMNTKDYIANLRAQVKQAEGLSEADARRSVELEDREAVIAAAEAERTAQEAERAHAQQIAAEAESRRQADIAEFQQTFPDAAKDPDKIPPQVWAEVRNGSSLVAAYARYAVSAARQDAANAQRESAAAQQNQKNASRSTGSMKSAGAGLKAKDPFLEGWGD